MPCLYVGTIGEGIWRSRDGGATYSRLAGGLFVECSVRALARHPADDRALYLGTELGLFASQDAGDNWRLIDPLLQGKQIWSILVLSSRPEVMLAGACPAEVFRSEDHGASWRRLDLPLRQDCPRIYWNRVTTLAADPFDPQTVWMGVEIDGLWRSTDAGRTWTRRTEGLSSQDIHGLAIVPETAGGRRMFASTNNDLNLSLNDALSWTPLGLGKVSPAPYFRGLAQKEKEPQVLFLGNGDFPPGTVGHVLRSIDGGRSWTAAPLPGPANSTIWTFATHPANPDLVFAASVSGEIYRSGDAGKTWEKLPREFGEIRALLWTP